MFEGTVEFAGHVALDLALQEGCFENWLDDGVDFFSRHCDCHERVFDSFHDSDCLIVPCFGLLKAFGLLVVCCSIEWLFV